MGSQSAARTTANACQQDVSASTLRLSPQPVGSTTPSGVPAVTLVRFHERCAPGLPELFGEGKRDGFRPIGLIRLNHTTPYLQSSQDLGDTFFRRRGARGYANYIRVADPCLLDAIRIVNQVRSRAQPLGKLAQPIGIGRVGRAHHKDNITAAGQFANRVLAILRGITDIVFAGPFESRKSLAERIDDRLRIIDRECRLSDKRKIFRIAHLEVSSLFFTLNKVNRPAIVPITSGCPA